MIGRETIPLIGLVVLLVVFYLSIDYPKRDKHEQTSIEFCDPGNHCTPNEK